MDYLRAVQGLKLQGSLLKLRWFQYLLESDNQLPQPQQPQQQQQARAVSFNYNRKLGRK